MRSFWLSFALLASLLALLPGTLAGCNVRSVQVSTADAQNQAITAITEAFAACSKCPCQIKVQAQAKVVADVRKTKFYTLDVYSIPHVLLSLASFDYTRI